MQQKSDALVFFWPSDPDVVKPLRPALYPPRVEIAISAGVELAEYFKMIAGRNPDLRVQFVGYSLGCRVVLSAVQQLSEPPQQVPVVRVLLMGAAVPQGDCVAPGPWPDKVSTLFGGAQDPKISKKSDVILYSLDDEILGGWMFERGEKKARKRGLQSRGGLAVGLTGGPPDRWTNAVPFRDLKHTDYLSNEETLKNVAAMFGRLINRNMGKRADGKRFLHAQQLAERQLASRPETGRPTGS